MSIDTPHYLIFRSGNAFGDDILSMWFCHVLNENGIPAQYFHESKPVVYVKKYFPNLPLAVIAPRNYENRYEFTYVAAWDEAKKYPGLSIMDWIIGDFKARFKIDKEIKYGKFLPISYSIELTPVYDVAVNTKTSGWVRHRDYPNFQKLFQLFKKEGISYVDLDAKNIRDNKAISTVARAGMYLGLESGMSHYVSAEARHKALILQSGFTDNRFWNHYDYPFLTKEVECAPCQLRYSACPYGQRCMTELEPEIVLSWVKDTLK